MVHSEPIFLTMHVLALSRESSPSACLPTCLQLLIPFYPRDEQTLSSPQSVASPLALLLFSSSIPPSLLSPPFPFFPPLSHRSFVPSAATGFTLFLIILRFRARQRICFSTFSQAQRRKAGPFITLALCLFLWCAEKDNRQTGSRRRKGFWPVCFKKCWSQGMKRLAL